MKNLVNTTGLKPLASPDQTTVFIAIYIVELLVCPPIRRSGCDYNHYKFHYRSPENLVDWVADTLIASVLGIFAWNACLWGSVPRPSRTCILSGLGDVLSIRGLRIVSDEDYAEKKPTVGRSHSAGFQGILFLLINVIIVFLPPYLAFTTHFHLFPMDTEQPSLADDWHFLLAYVHRSLMLTLGATVCYTSGLMGLTHRIVEAAAMVVLCNAPS
ncbi:hypothetical protein B0H14DRAFT_3884550 [Mycena olivaceomarginata]|nr:hypothetical protein B0H14DRAFT_3884550 [Mycena olivaceomarginata]